MNCVVFLSLVAAASAHLCMISPPQRGSMMGLNKIASPDCFLTVEPCGGRPTLNPTMSVQSMENFTVTIQKNLDHWVQSHPGYFDIGVSDTTTRVYTPLVRIMDRGEPSLHLYSVNITFPANLKNKVVILQSQYVTKNPSAPKTFFQCADVMVN